jgi:hypothetical protein
MFNLFGLLNRKKIERELVKFVLKSSRVKIAETIEPYLARLKSLTARKRFAAGLRKVADEIDGTDPKVANHAAALAIADMLAEFKT